MRGGKKQAQAQAPHSLAEIRNLQQSSYVVRSKGGKAKIAHDARDFAERILSIKRRIGKQKKAQREPMVKEG